MGMFIEVLIDQQKCLGMEACGDCFRACPVGIFAGGEALPQIVEQNQDECIICEQCQQSCEPKAITVCRLYE